MPKSSLESFQWDIFAIILKQERSGAWKLNEIYKMVQVPTDPPIPDDIESDSRFEPLITFILDCARDQNQEQELLEAIIDLIRAINAANSSQIGQKRTHSQADVGSESELEGGVSALELDEGVGEMLGAMNADNPHFDRRVLPTNDYAPICPQSQFEMQSNPQLKARGQRKRLKEDQEPKPYVSLSTILASQPFGELMSKVEAGIADFIDSYSETLPLWEPGPAWDDHPEVLACLRDLKIPHVPLGGKSAPDMLLAALGTGQLLDMEIQAHIQQLMSDSSRSWNLLNASGCGKTRLLFEILVRHWAFYFACAHGDTSSPYGSKDIRAALQIIAQESVAHRHRTEANKFFQPSLEADERKLASKTDEEVEAIIVQRQTNREIAEHVFHVVVLARTLVFETFLVCWQRAEDAKQPRPTQRREAKGKATKSKGGDPSSRPRTRPKYDPRTRDQTVKKLFDDGISNLEAAIRTWAYLQISPDLVLGTGSSPDVFCLLLHALQWTSRQSVLTETDARLRALRAHTGITLASVMFDEVQSLASSWSTAFGPEDLTVVGDIRARAASSRPVLKPLTIAVMSSMLPGTKCLLASTKFNEFLVNEAIISGVLKDTGIPQRFVTFGDQGTPRKLAGTLRRFFGDAYLKDTIDRDLWNELQYWLIGRFLMVFIQFVLRTGPESLPNVFKNILWRLTGHSPLGITQINSMDHSRLIMSAPDVRKRIASNERNLFCIREIVYAWIFHGRYPLMQEADIELVTLGIGRLVPEAGTVSGVQGVSTSENLIAAALFNWLEDGEQVATQEKKPEKLQWTRLLIYRDLSQLEPSTRGFALENSLVYLFWDAFSKDCLLEDVFDFAYLAPSWRGQTARLVDVCRKHSGNGVPLVLTRDLTTRLAWRTDTIRDTLAWFKRGGLPNLRVPFLRPDNYIGPDLLFILRLASGEEILVCVQSKAWSRKRSADEVLAEAWKLSPERYYGTDVDLKKDWQRDAVARHQSAVQEHLKEMLLPSKVDMSSPGDVVKNDSKYAYATAPTYPILRVFAAYEGSYTVPDTAPGKMGQYPLAFLSKKFLSNARAMFPSMDEAAKAVGKHRDEQEEEKKKKKKKKKATATRAKRAAKIAEEDETDDEELLAFIGPGAAGLPAQAETQMQDEIDKLLWELNGARG
ncbi:hypothetical protein AURDEDRAFT_167239 [Auricularia subglabra TFB-10046 SS5]|nr:hypothetical protein AURDEDRAFT_167239 [Auricularia subglabra TFB-10046 SS5]